MAIIDAELTAAGFTNQYNSGKVRGGWRIDVFDVPYVVIDRIKAKLT